MYSTGYIRFLGLILMNKRPSHESWRQWIRNTKTGQVTAGKKAKVMQLVDTACCTSCLWGLGSVYLIILAVVLMNVKLPQSPKISVTKTFLMSLYLVSFQCSRNYNEEIKSFFIDNRNTVPKTLWFDVLLALAFNWVSGLYLIFWKIAFSR